MVIDLTWQKIPFRWSADFSTNTCGIFLIASHCIMSPFPEDTRPNIRSPSAISVGLTGTSLAFSSLLSCSPSFESALCSLVVGFKMLPKMDYGVKSKWDKKIPATLWRLQRFYILSYQIPFVTKAKLQCKYKKQFNRFQIAFVNKTLCFYSQNYIFLLYITSLTIIILLVK